MKPASDPPVQLGFLSIVEREEGEYSGGMLVVSLAGRPLEFHCTAPAKPNRAQQILYGPTLRPYLFGEQIAPTLIGRVKAPLGWVATDQPDVLTAVTQIDIPLLLLNPEDVDGHEPSDADRSSHLAQRELPFRVDGAHSPESQLGWHASGQHKSSPWIAAQSAADARASQDRFEKYAFEGELTEPFQRIREAIEETLQTAGR